MALLRRTSTCHPSTLVSERGWHLETAAAQLSSGPKIAFSMSHSQPPHDEDDDDVEETTDLIRHARRIQISPLLFHGFL